MAEIEGFIASHGSVDAHPEHIRSSMNDERSPGTGNPIIVARMLHCAVYLLRSTGWVTAQNSPANPGLRAHYTAMGFDDAERVDLGDVDSIERCFWFLKQLYGGVDRDLTLPP